MSTNVGSIHYDLSLNSKKFDAATGKVSKQLDKMGDSIKRISKKFALATVAMTSATAVLGVKTAADFETARSALVGLLGSAEEADKTLARIKLEAKRTPFELTGLTQGVKQLSSVSENGDEAIDILLNVGKAITASGGGQEELDRVVFNLKQIKGMGKLEGIDLKELRRAIPIFDKLVLAAGTTVEKIQASSDPAAELFRVFEEGGKKINAVDQAFSIQAGNFNQRLSNMKDSFAIFASDFVIKTGIFDFAKDAIGRFTAALDNNTDKIIENVNKGWETLSKAVRTVLPYIKDFIQAVITTGKNIFNYLAPKIVALFNTLKNDLMPALKELTTELILPLAAALGKTLVFALGLAVDIFNAFAKVISPIIRNLSGFKDIIISVTIALTALRIIRTIQSTLVQLGSGFTAATIRAVGFKGAITAMLMSISPLTLAITGFSIIFGLLGKQLHDHRAKVAQAEQAQAELAQRLEEYANNQYQKAIQAYKDLATAADNYHSITRRLKDTELAVKDARDKLTAANQRYGENSQQALDANAELLEQESNLSQLHIDRKENIEELRLKILEQLGSTKALRDMDIEQIKTNLIKLESIRASMQAQQLNTDAIDNLIDSAKRLIEIKDVTVTTKADTVHAQRAINDVRMNLLNLPKNHVIRIASDLSNFRVPNGVIGGWKGAPFKYNGYADGTDNHQGGLAMVGERGPELVNLPRGAQVTPNRETKEMIGGGKGTVNFYQPVNIYDKSDAMSILRMITNNQQLSFNGTAIQR